MHIFVIGNEKGGVGKTTCCMHLISALLEMGLKVSSIDIDIRQRSLTRYIENRTEYNKNNPEYSVKMPHHFVLQQGNDESLTEKFHEVLSEAKNNADVVVIDTPGSDSFLSRMAHSNADTIITPMNDSFIDMDVLAKVDTNLQIIMPSIYSEMVWQQKITKARRDNSGIIDWVVMRNRLSHVDALNKRNIGAILDELSTKIPFRIVPGLSERVIFRQLFLEGLTLLDLTKKKDRKLSISQVAARHELRSFLQALGIDNLRKKTA